MTDLKDKNDIKAAEKLLLKAECAVKEYSMLEKGDKVLIALSGGKDSVCLADMLCKISSRYGITLAACHLNHMIRGEEAFRDENFSRNLCEKYGMEFFFERVDVPKKAQIEKKSVEEAARDARYEFFGELSEKYGFNKIATAHTLSDQCETVLFNLIRGKGLTSVSGIPSVRALDDLSGTDIKLIRPIISLTTEDVLEYVRLNSLSYVTDSTNSDTVYARNLIRHEIIPIMKRINPSFEKSIQELSSEAKNYHDLINDECDVLFKVNINRGDTVFAPISPAAYLARDRKRQTVLYEYLFRMLPKKKGVSLTRERFEAIRDFLSKINDGNFSHIGKEIVLGSGLVCVFEKDTFGFIEKEHVSRKKGEQPGGQPGENSSVVDCLRGGETERIPLFLGENDILFSDCIITVEKCTDMRETQDLNKKNMTIYVDSAVINRGLFARKRLSGDKIVYGGMSHSVKKILAEAGFPSHKRSSVPVICDGEGIVWIPGGTVCDRCNPFRSNSVKDVAPNDLIKITYRSKTSF